METCFAVPYQLAFTLGNQTLIPQLSVISFWINEIHCDNVVGDVREFVEITGVAGTDLGL